MVLVRQWFWFSNGGPIVMGPMWSDGLPLFSVLCSLFVGLIVRGSSSAKFHSFNRRFLSLYLSLSLSLSLSLQWSLPPCWIQWHWFVLLFLLSYSVFSLILHFVWSPKKWRERKIKIGNWDINVLIFGFNYNGVRSIFVLFHFQSFLESQFTCRGNGGKENI